MTIIFSKLSYGQTVPSSGRNIGYLRQNNWDDYSYKSLFHLSIFDNNGNCYNIGDLKIGYSGQISPSWTETEIPESFHLLDPRFFSLGQDADYYKNISELPLELKSQLMNGLCDVVFDTTYFNRAEGQSVFNTSLLRSISLALINDQFKRVINGGVLLSDYDFRYKTEQNETNAGLSLEFNVKANSQPSTNIHVLIGRNGIGKTTLLNGMISSLIEGNLNRPNVGTFSDLSRILEVPITNDFFSNLVSVSFSAFDPFTPPLDRSTTLSGISYSYIGLKDIYMDEGERKSRHKDLDMLSRDFIRSFNVCLSLQKKKELWLDAIKCLGSDINFAEMDLKRLADNLDPTQLSDIAGKVFSRMSSGHAVVLLTVTKLVEKVEEKTLVVMDEPESHLHPPLLSAFTRALSNLLINRNGVAIIATHSPVILQEVPKSCVWKVARTRLAACSERPESETFGENVGVLTREVFGLEVSKSGFHDLLEKSVNEGKNYDLILSEYNYQLGFEGKAVLRALIANRDSQSETH